MTDAEDEAAWVSRCLRGDSAAFEPIVQRYQRVLFSVAYRMLGNQEDARDATQSAFIRAYEGLGGYDPKRRFFSWIYRIVVNECLNLRRARRQGEPLDERIEADASHGPLETVQDLERSASIDAALVRLSDDHRLVIVLRHFADLSYEEMSDALGVPEKTVKSRLFEARQRLADLLRTKAGAEL
jgi:RNA polymerase sigma-70 factor (ECF subfamily)